MFGWLRERKRTNLASAPFPPEWEAALGRRVPYYALLTDEEKETLRADIQVFVAEKYWEGCGGLELTDEIKVTVAAQACLLLLNIEHDFYPNVETVLVYPSSYRARHSWQEGGVVFEAMHTRLGEAWQVGPVVLSWHDVQVGGDAADDGQNVVFHEFAHKLDMIDGWVDGVPTLRTDAEYEAWARAMSEGYAALRGAAEAGEPYLMDEYGATNAGEFFAVATETFFEKPRRMRAELPDLYAVLADYFRQDPAARLDAHNGRGRDEAGDGRDD